jgi:hypothetical protein
MTTTTTIRTRPATVTAAKLPTLARVGAALALALLVMATGAGLAQAAPKRLGVLNFRGPAEGATRNVVTKVGKAHKYQVVGGQAIAKTASKLHVTLSDNDGFRAVAKELGIAAFVTGEVTKKKAMLTVRSGEDGSVSAEASWAGANPRKVSKAVAKTFWRRLGPAIERSNAPSGAKQAVVAEEAAAPETGADEPGDEPAASKSDNKKVAEEAAPSDSDRPRKSSKKKSDGDEAGSETTVSEHADEPEGDSGMTGQALILGVGPRILSRALAYTDDRYHRNSKYNLGVAPEVGLNVELYPGALAGVGGIASDIGVVADVSYMLPVVTSPAPNKVGQYKTYSLAWSAGAKIRLPFGLFGTVAYGSQRFQLQPSMSGTSGVDVPMVDYRFVRIGGGGRFAVTPEVSIMANLAYLHCLSLGQIAFASYYPKATCAAVEAGGGVGYRVSSLIEVQGGVSLRRFGLNFHQVYGDQYASVATDTSIRVAGGAVDQYILGYVALAVVLGGSGDGAHKSAEPESDGGDESAKKKSDDSEKSEKDDKDEKDDEEAEL